jgi:hypothetical protein
VLLLLGLAFLLRALPVPPAQARAFEALLSDPHMLCLGQGGAQGEEPADSTHHEACDTCCLIGVRNAVLPPSSDSVPLVLGPVPDEIRPSIPSVVSARAPPAEAWSIVRAQRGPPSFDAN